MLTRATGRSLATWRWNRSLISVSSIAGGLSVRSEAGGVLEPGAAGLAPEGGAQAAERLGGLALDRPRRALQREGRLVDAEIAVEPQDQDRSLAWRQRRDRGPQVQRPVLIGRGRRRVREVAGDTDPPGPAAAPFVQELADHDGVDVSVDVPGPRGLRPVQVDPDDGLLHEIVGPVQVLAQQQGQPAQGRQPQGHVLDVVVVALRRHGAALDPARLLISCRGSQPTVLLPGPAISGPRKDPARATMMVDGDPFICMTADIDVSTSIRGPL